MKNTLFFFLAIMGLPFYLHFKYIHISLMTADIFGNQAHHTSSGLSKNTLPVMGNQGFRIRQKITLPTTDISIYYPLFLTLKNINTSANRKFKHQQRDLQMTSVGFARAKLGCHLFFLLEPNALFHVHGFVFGRSQGGCAQCATQRRLG